MSTQFLHKLSSVSSPISSLYAQIGSSEAWLAPIPSALGFPTSEVAQSSYYPGKQRISCEEIAAVSSVLEAESLHPENTRIRKSIISSGGGNNKDNNNNTISYDILQASVAADNDDTHEEPRKLFTRLESESGEGIVIRIVRGDHSDELSRICECLQEAQKHVANNLQENFLSEYIESFTTGDIEAYKSSQRTWVKDVQPSVETVLGFVEPYRDPFGVRAEFEGLVGIVHRGETGVLTTLVENSDKFIRRLPWAIDATENNGKGPFEKELFENPDFTSLHSEFN